MGGMAEAVEAREEARARLMRRALTVQRCVSCVDAALISARAAWCDSRGDIHISPVALPRRPETESSGAWRRADENFSLRRAAR